MGSFKRNNISPNPIVEAYIDRLLSTSRQLLGYPAKTMSPNAGYSTDFDYEIYYLRVEAWAVIKRP